MAEEQRVGAPELPTPLNLLAEATVAFVRDRFWTEIVEVVTYRGETTIVVRPSVIVRVCTALRDAPQFKYNFLADVTAVDWLEREPRYDVVYHLLSLETRAIIRLKVRVGAEGEAHPRVPSVTGVWSGANFFEREVFDLFGIAFEGHPQLERILMPDDWVGHPLRKDYPLTGIRLPEPHWGGQVPFDQPLPAGTGAQTLRVPDGTGDVSSGPAPIEERPEPRDD
jgi:NADH-quinone oxidoreductase subunit C